MYEIIKSVINSKVYELSDMLKKIDVIWLKNQITEEQRNELIKLAQDSADPTMSVDILARLDDHEKRLRALENGESVIPPSPGKYPEYVKGQPAYNGDKFMWKGKIYQCVLPEHVDVCVWTPDDYPAYWRAVAE